MGLSDVSRLKTSVAIMFFVSLSNNLTEPARQGGGDNVLSIRGVVGNKESPFSVPEGFGEVQIPPK